jgi:hypothetical protein
MEGIWIFGEPGNAIPFPTTKGGCFVLEAEVEAPCSLGGDAIAVSVGSLAQSSCFGGPRFSGDFFLAGISFGIANTGWLWVFRRQGVGQGFLCWRIR